MVKGIVAPPIPEHLDLEWYSYNPQMAIQLLEDAGWKDDGSGTLKKKWRAL